MQKTSYKNRFESDDEQSLQTYFREIAQVDLLTREEEVEIARRMRSGSSRAREHLIRANLRFVVSVAKRYRSQGLSLADLIHEGNLGLIEAARRFDETRGNRFISYAVWWIRQSILKALAEKARLIRLPVSRTGTVQRILKETERLRQVFGREPTSGEVADAVALSESEIRETLNLSSICRSLDVPEGNGEGENSLKDYLEDTLTPAPDEELIEGRMQRDVGAALQSLSGREVDVLRSYFGFEENGGETLEQIGRRMNLSRERVRQIKEQAIGRLRQSRNGKALRSYLS